MVNKKIQFIIDEHDNKIQELLELINGYELKHECATIIDCYMQIAISHKKAIHTLIMSQLCQSALTMLRPLYDSVLRGLYVQCCMDTSSATQFIGGKNFPIHGEKFFNKIDENYKLNTFFSVHTQKYFTSFHDYTHGGALQLEKCNYSNIEYEEILTELIKGSTAIIILFFYLIYREQKLDITLFENFLTNMD